MESKKQTLAYITTNIAPFRVLLLDRLSKCFNIILCYFVEIEKGTKKEYVNKRSDNIEFSNISKMSFLKRVKKIKTNKYVIFDGYTGFKKIAIMLLCIFTRKKYFISVDGVIPKKSGFFKKKLKSLLLRKAVSVFSTNKSTNNYLLSINKKINIVSHIFITLTNSDRNAISNLKRGNHWSSKLGLEGNKKNILFVGKFVKTKGIYNLLKFAELYQNKYNFIFVGGNKNELNLPNVSDKFRFISFLEKDEILDLMINCDLFVLPTFTDVWGLVVVEAVSCCLPVVTTYQCNAGTELIKNGINGYLFNYSDEQQLFNCIEKSFDLDYEKLKLYNSKMMEKYTVEEAALLMRKELLSHE